MNSAIETRIKICGITTLEDAIAAEQAGADAIGFVFANSPRQVSPDVVQGIIDRLGPFIQTFGVFVDAPIDTVLEFKARCGLSGVQLHGNEDEHYVKEIPGRVVKAVTTSQLTSVSKYPNTTLLVDSPGGGTGRTVDWDRVAPIAKKRRIILAGGLTPDNVTDAISKVRPYGVDVSSGVEFEKGRKDPAAMRLFVRKVRAFAKTGGADA